MPAYLHPGAAELRKPKRKTPFAWRFTSPLFLGSALNPINSSLIATALVPIAHSLGVSVGKTSVLVASLYLASAIAQPTAGKLAEELGPRRVFLAGILLVLVGGIIGGLAHDLTTLIVARVLIGIGTSAGYPSAMVLIRRRAADAGMDAPPGGVLGGLSIAATVTTAVGPPIGGVLVDATSWRAAFLVNIPVALIALAMTASWIGRDPKLGRTRTVGEITRRIDLTGIVIFAATMSALLVFLLDLPSAEWAFLAAAFALAGVLVAWELRAATPFIDMRLLASNKALTRTYMRGLLSLLGIYTILYGITQWLEAGHGFSAEQAGLLILPMGALAAIVSRPIASHNLVRGPLIAGAAAALAGSVGVLLLTTSTPALAIVAVTLLFGITFGTIAVGNQTALYTQAPAAQVGTAAGLYRTFSYIGSIASATITSIVFRTKVDDGGLHTLALILIGVSAVVLLMTVLDRRLRTARRS
ncbi:MAG TPA: MFS transporter [Conexibacter sp.]